MNHQKPQNQKMECQIHKSEIILIDLDSSETGQVQYLCCNCLIERKDNKNMFTIEQTLEQIKQLKTQRQSNQANKIQTKLKQLNNIKEQVMEFKRNIQEDSQKIISQITEQIITIQEEQQTFTTLDNFFEDVKSLSEFHFRDTQEKQIEFQQDSEFIDKISQQFKLIYNNSSYSKTIDTFIIAQQKLNEIYEIQVTTQQTKNVQKTPSLNKICQKHNKEIIMIDIDSKNTTIDDRFFCVDCIIDHPECQYRTVENINEKWISAMQKKNKFIIELKSKRQKKQEKLIEKMDNMRQNYNSELNEISKQLITQFSLPKTKPSEISKFKYTSLQQLSNNELLSQINFLIQYDEEQLIQDSNIERIKLMDFSQQNEIKIKLENLQQHDSLDIQESINILEDISNDNQIKGIQLLSQQIQENSKENKEQLIVKQELDELIKSSRQIYSQLSLFNQTIVKYQEHIIKIINLKTKTIPEQSNLKNFQKEIQDYYNKFENDFKQFKKFCEIDNIQKGLEQLNQDYQKLQQETKQNNEDQNKIIDKLKQDLKSTNEEIQQLKKLQKKEHQLKLKRIRLQKLVDPILNLYFVQFQSKTINLQNVIFY